MIRELMMAALWFQEDITMEWKEQTDINALKNQSRK